MTKQQAQQEFTHNIKPYIIKRYPNDKPALRQAWNDFTDNLCKQGHITLKQYETWTSPISQKG